MQRPFDYHRLIVGYHGCDRSTGEKVLLEGHGLEPSDNDYDWLGEGIYFWEFGRDRALRWAQEKQERNKIQDPFVLGAYVHLGHCFDLTDTYHTSQLAPAYKTWRTILEAAGVDPPENERIGDGDTDRVLRYRDCAVLNWYLQQSEPEGMDEAQNDVYYQTVRGVFVEGDRAFEGSEIMMKTHVQVAVRDPRCILGYFRPATSPEDQ